MSIRALAVCLSVAVVSVVPAQDAADEGLSRLRAAWGECQAAEASYHAAAKQAGRALESAGKDDREAARARYLEAVEAPQAELIARQRAFYRRFAEVGYDALDVEADRRMLIAGLLGAGRELVEDEPVRAIGMFDALLSHYPDSQEAKQVVQLDLWKAQIAARRLDAAVGTYERFASSAKGAERAQLLLVLGDLQAVRGDVEAARATWQTASTGLDSSGAGERTANALDQRLALVGRPAPEIDARDWIGAESRSLSSMKGTVVVLDFWATWCEPCRGVMPALGALREENHGRGLEVVGVTRFYSDGYLPSNPEQMRSGGQPVADMDVSSFRQHLVDFRRNSGIAYPFAVASAKDFESYRVRGIPSLAIVDRAGAVAMVVVGSGSEMVVEAVVERLLGDS